jgi:YidC/Oxa1 family membrane protein insertase
VWGTACYVDGKLKEQHLKDLREGAKAFPGDVRWSALSHQYFLFAAAPLENEPSVCGVAIAEGAKPGTVAARVSYPTPVALDANQSSKHGLLIYVGPKNLDQLESVSTFAGRETKFVESVDLGWFGFLARPMLAMLKFFYSVVGSWGIAIILLTITVKLATLYWTTKSMRSMKNLAKLKPEMDEIRKKYANDKQRLNVELMNMYKRHQISPFGGCLPMLLQMPVWIALFQTLRSAAELYRAPFAGWIQDLTAPDPYYILPIAMTALMFVQARIQPAAVDSQQQKIMQWMMPAMFGFMSLVFPSGLALYMFTNSVLSILHQLWMNRTDPPKTAVAAATVVIDAPASPPPHTANRPPKKNKGGGKKMVKA